MKILFVENHARFAHIVTTQFLSAHKVEIVSSLDAARAALTRDAFDIVLLDYDLDDGKDDELARELSTRAVRPKIIGVSSHEKGNAEIHAAGAAASTRSAQFSSALCDKQNAATAAFCLVASGAKRYIGIPCLSRACLPMRRLSTRSSGGCGRKPSTSRATKFWKNCGGAKTARSKIFIRA